MTNIEAVQRFEQAHAAKIDKLIWIAGSLDHIDLKDMLGYIEDADFKNCFPEIYNSEYYKEYLDNEDLVQALIDFNKCGLIAEINIPEATDFSYKNGKIVSWSSNDGICRIAYVYGETMEELMQQIEKVSGNIFNEYVEADKKKASNL